MNPIERERVLLSDPELFAAVVTRRAWGWKNIDPWQREVLTFEDRYGIINASRQSGKSSTLSVKVFRKSVITPNGLFLILAKQDQAEEDMRKIKDLHKAYTDHLRERYGNALTLDLVEDNKNSVEFGNRARIKALAATERTRGYSAPEIVWIDEARDVPDEAFIAINPMMIVSQGQLIISSTPGGTSGFLPKEWVNPRYTFKKMIPWWECPRIPKEEIDRERLIYGEAYVRQEYECRFQDDTTSLFSEKSLYESVDPNQPVLNREMEAITRKVKGDDLI